MIGFEHSKAFVKIADTNDDLSGFTKQDFLNDMAGTLAGLAVEEKANGKGNFQAGVLFDIK